MHKIQDQRRQFFVRLYIGGLLKKLTSGVSICHHVCLYLDSRFFNYLFFRNSKRSAKWLLRDSLQILISPLYFRYILLFPKCLNSLCQNSHSSYVPLLTNPPFVIALVVLQVGHLGEAYEEWVHQPIVTKEGPRFFHSDFWEVHKFLSPFLFSNRQCQQASDLHYLDTLAMETVLDPYKMVGDSCNLVASGMLVHLQVSKHGPFPYRNRPIDCLGNIYLDVHRIYSSPVPFPHQDQELLVRHTHTLFFYSQCVTFHIHYQSL